MATQTIVERPLFTTLVETDIIFARDNTDSVDKQTTTGFLADYILQEAGKDWKIEKNNPIINIVKDNASAEQKRWFFDASINGQLGLSISTDAGTNIKDFLRFYRTGNSQTETRITSNTFNLYNSAGNNYLMISEGNGLELFPTNAIAGKGAEIILNSVSPYAEWHIDTNNDKFRIFDGTNTRLQIQESTGDTELLYSTIFLGGTTGEDLVIARRATWANGTGNNYPTIYSTAGQEWIMLHNPHIPYLKTGIGGYTDLTTIGATIKYSKDVNTTAVWEAGIYPGFQDKFSIIFSGSNKMWVDETGLLNVGSIANITCIGFANITGNVQLFNNLTVDGSATFLNNVTTATVPLKMNGRTTYGNSATKYPTIYSGNSNEWVMYHAPHIPYLQTGIDGYVGINYGAKIRFAKDIGATGTWDIGIYPGFQDRFSILFGASAKFSITEEGTMSLFGRAYLVADGTTWESGLNLLISGGTVGWNFLADSGDSNKLKINYEGTIAGGILVFKTDGNIGIRQNNPVEALDMNGNLKINGNAHLVGNRFLYFEDGASDPNYFLASYPFNDSAGMQLKGYAQVRLDTSVSTLDLLPSLMTLTTTGGFLNNDSTDLSVDATLNLSPGATNRWAITGSSDTSATGLGEAFWIWNNDRSSRDIFIDGDTGNVGIGNVTSPFARLTIEKNVNGENNLYLNNPNTGTSAYDVIRLGTAIQTEVGLGIHHMGNNYVDTSGVYLGDSSVITGFGVNGLRLWGFNNPIFFFAGDPAQSVMTLSTANVSIAKPLFANNGLTVTTPTQLNSNLTVEGFCTFLNNVTTATVPLKMNGRTTYGNSATKYPTIYSGNSNEWVMYHAPHIPYLQTGIDGYVGINYGARVRYSKDIDTTGTWDTGIIPGFQDRFSILFGSTTKLSITEAGTATIFGKLIIPDGLGIGVSLLEIGDDSFFTDIDVANTLGLYGKPNSDRCTLQLGSAGATLRGEGGTLFLDNTDLQFVDNNIKLYSTLINNGMEFFNFNGSSYVEYGSIGVAIKGGINNGALSIEGTGYGTLVPDIILFASGTTVDNTIGTTANAPLRMVTRATFGNLMCIAVLGSAGTKHIFRANGDIYTDTGFVGSYDTENDIMLARATQLMMAKEKYDISLQPFVDRLQELGIMENGFLSMQKTHALELGAIYQLKQEQDINKMDIEELKEHVIELENKIKLLEAK
jgi:hypothetical protein